MISFFHATAFQRVSWSGRSMIGGTLRQTNLMMLARMKTSTTTPGSAVSVCVRCNEVILHTPFYLLVKRGKKPNKGLWSLPGGEIQYGETALAAAKRELDAQTKWISVDRKSDDVTDDGDDKNDDDDENDDDNDDDDDDEDDYNYDNVMETLSWYDGTVTTTDTMGPGFHFLTAHCFAQASTPEGPSPRTILSQVHAAGDAAIDAGWFSMTQIRLMDASQKTPGLAGVVQRIETLYRAGVIPTTRYF